MKYLLAICNCFAVSELACGANIASYKNGELHIKISTFSFIHYPKYRVSESCKRGLFEHIGSRRHAKLLLIICAVEVKHRSAYRAEPQGVRKIGLLF